jgi:hypothetical protein
VNSRELVDAIIPDSDVPHFQHGDLLGPEPELGRTKQDRRSFKEVI